VGCDIHAYAEVKRNNEWYFFGSIHFYRNYKLFGKLAGVRSIEPNPLAPDRGIPADASEITRMLYDRYTTDWHSASYATSEECKELEQWWDEENEREYYERCGGIGIKFSASSTFELKASDEELDILKQLGDIQDYRMVFWFDN
jgi:hypothetical protein